MFQWQFSSRVEKDPKWYIIAIIVVLSLVVYGITQGLYMLSVVAFLFAGVYMLKENNSEPIMSVEVSDTGIRVHKTFYEYAKIASFAILFDDGVARLLRISLRKGIAGIIDIPLTHDVNPVELKNFLLEHLDENTNAEFSGSDKIIRAMKL